LALLASLADLARSQGSACAADVYSSDAHNVTFVAKIGSDKAQEKFQVQRFTAGIVTSG